MYAMYVSIWVERGGTAYTLLYAVHFFLIIIFYCAFVNKLCKNLVIPIQATPA